MDDEVDFTSDIIFVKEEFKSSNGFFIGSEEQLGAKIKVEPPDDDDIPSKLQPSDSGTKSPAESYSDDVSEDANAAGSNCCCGKKYVPHKLVRHPKIHYTTSYTKFM